MGGGNWLEQSEAVIASPLVEEGRKERKNIPSSMEAITAEMRDLQIKSVITSGHTDRRTQEPNG